MLYIRERDGTSQQVGSDRAFIVQHYPRKERKKKKNSHIEELGPILDALSREIAIRNLIGWVNELQCASDARVEYAVRVD